MNVTFKYLQGSASEASEAFKELLASGASETVTLPHHGGLRARPVWF